MDVKYAVATSLICLGLLSGCVTTNTPLSCPVDLQQYPPCQRYSCLHSQRYACGNYWHTTCYPVCNETGADFCRTCQGN